MSFDHKCRVQSSQCIIREITELLLNITVATDGLLCLKNASTQISMIGLGKCYQKTSNKKCHMADFGLVHCRTVETLCIKHRTWHIGPTVVSSWVRCSWLQAFFKMRSTQEIHTHSKLGYNICMCQSHKTCRRLAGFCICSLLELVCLLRGFILRWLGGFLDSSSCVKPR